MLTQHRLMLFIALPALLTLFCGLPSNGEPGDLTEEELTAISAAVEILEGTATFTPTPSPTATATATETPFPPTATATPAPTDTPFPPTPTATPMPVASISFTDEGPIYNCDTGAEVDDPEVDLETISASLWVDPNELRIDAKMKSPLESDFSFAVLLFVLSEVGETQAYVWEVHNLVQTVGQLSPTTGQVITDIVDGPQIDHDLAAGVLTFALPQRSLPEPFTQVGLRSFHTPVDGANKNCDDAGLYELPEEMRRFPDQ